MRAPEMELRKRQNEDEVNLRIVNNQVVKIERSPFVESSSEIDGKSAGIQFQQTPTNSKSTSGLAAYGPPTKGTAPLLSSDGSTLLTEKTQILQRWAEHFRGVLNRPSAISDAAIDRLPQVETNVDLDLPPSLQETIRAVQQLSSGKAPGSEAIPAEVYEHGGPHLIDHLTALFQEMWRQGEVPRDFKDATIVHLYKRKGNRQVCDNHRGISLLNIAGKIFARILLNRLNKHQEQGQCGFRRYRGTMDMIFAARQLQDKCQEMRTHLYSTFVDLTKAFDTVNREGLWKIMQKFGCPERFTQMSHVLCHADGRLPRRTPRDPHRLQDGWSPAESTADALQSRVSTTTVHELLFADDCALDTTSEEEMQRSMDLFSAACENFGLVINTQKTVVMHQPRHPTQIPLLPTRRKSYLGSTLSRNTKIDDEVARRISRFQRVLDANGHCGLGSDLLDIFGSTAPLELHQPSSPPSASSSSSLPPTNSDSSSEPPLPSSSSSSSSTTITASTTAAQAAVSHITNPVTTTDTIPTTSDFSDEYQDYTCPHCDRTFTSHIGLVGRMRSIAQRLANQCLEHQPTPTAPGSTAHTALALSRIAWAYSATCASTRAALTAVPTHPPR
ncbi:hypothetical protein SprV_0301158800 [Sparganum proliferum]